MKKSILLLTFLTFSFLSCSSDDSSNSVDNSLLIGKWDLVSKKQGNTNIPLTNCEQQNLNSSYEFFSNNTSIKKEGYSSGSSSCSFDLYNQTYSVSGNVLTANESDPPLYQYKEKYYISSITSTTLVLKMFYFMENYDGDVAEENIAESQQITYTYERVN